MSENIERAAGTVSTVVGIFLVSTLVGVGGSLLYENVESLTDWIPVRRDHEKWVLDLKRDVPFKAEPVKVEMYDWSKHGQMGFGISPQPTNFRFSSQPVAFPRGRNR